MLLAREYGHQVKRLGAVLYGLIQSPLFYLGINVTNVNDSYPNYPKTVWLIWIGITNKQSDRLESWKNTEDLITIDIWSNIATEITLQFSGGTVGRLETPSVAGPYGRDLRPSKQCARPGDSRRAVLLPISRIRTCGQTERRG